MPPDPLPPFHESRQRIAQKLRELRLARRLTQEELAARLHVSQGQLSQLERGNASLTAEQFLEVLRFFNVPASDFAPADASGERELQNALARLGATHLQESPDVVAGERFQDLTNVLREALVASSSRLVTAIAPVLVANLDRIVLRKLLSDLTAAGLEQRFAWVVDNTVDALRQELEGAPAGEWRIRARHANAVLSDFLGFLRDHLGEGAKSSPDDVVDGDIGSRETLDVVRRQSSPISRYWHIVSSLHPDDFLEALREARATR
jgi:transcriptional regulator with XRE-family HTH domain